MGKKFKYNTSGNWYKGNTHIHSTASDGGKNIEELDRMYSSAGYDFAFLTDHWNTSDFSGNKQFKINWFEGVEYDAFNYESDSLFHIVLLGKNCYVNHDMSVQDVINEGRKKNAVIIFAHPHWCGNSTEDGIRYDFDGVEVYNHTCEGCNGKSNGQIHWEQMLLKKQNTLAIASDDTHAREGIDPWWNGGWIVANSKKCDYESIMLSIKSGNYYSSTGPGIYSITCENELVTVETSKVQKIRLIGNSYNADLVLAEEDTIQGHTFKVPSYWKYAFLQIEDSMGKKAWTNNLFC